MCAKRTPVTFFNKSSTDHSLSHGSKNSFPCFFIFFSHTLLGAIFSFTAGRILKDFVAVLAHVCGKTASSLRPVATLIGTIFGCIAPGRIKRKMYPADFTIFGSFIFNVQSMTRTRTVLGCVFSVLFYFKDCATIQALNINLRGNFHAA